MSERPGWILVAGYGSIGRRHYQNLRALGRHDVRLLRTSSQRPGRFESPEGATVYTDLSAALRDAPGVVIVANPTSLHVGVARAAVEAGASVLLEKPVCDDLSAAGDLLRQVRDAGGVCGMAYCFRYHPLYRAMHDLAASGRLGRVFSARTWQASYLPDWHPWEDYHQGYAARGDLGGGVVRTLDHELDQVRWTLGQPTDVLASAGAISGIGVSVEDTADMIFRLPGRVQASVHVCFARRDAARGMCLVGEDATAVLDWAGGVVTVSSGGAAETVARLDEGYELNEMYVDMLRDAMACFDADEPRAAIDLADGVAVLEMATAALHAADDGRAVAVLGV